MTTDLIHTKPFAWLVVAMAAVAAALAYWTGLRGPFLLDDESNLHDLLDWQAGRLGLASLLFERGAGMFGRPVSMASFALNVSLGGYSPYAFKVGNLLVHVLTGMTIFGFSSRLLHRDPRLQARAPLLAAIVAALWLLHPLHASTVLYAVQRMAQLSTLLTVAGLWFYLVVRERLEREPGSIPTVALLLGVPAITGFAFLAKENGALLPLLCLVLELFWFRAPRPQAVRAFLTLFVLIPILGGAVLVVARPGRFLGGYVARDFTLPERLLSQGRALCDYLWKLVVPNPPQMGVYTDDFPISTGLFSPPSTLFAILLLVALSVLAWRWRTRLPAVSFGWFFFLVAHALEAGILPLELYFEHRNYLPSVGILLALVALAAAAGGLLERGGIRPGRIGMVLAVAVLTVLGVGTHGRARIWRSDVLIAESSLRAHPHSLRANVAVMTTAIRYGDRAQANQAVERLIHSPVARHRSLGHAFRLLMECELDHEGRPGDLEAFVTQTPLPLTLYEMHPFSLLFPATGKHACAPFTDKMFGDALARLADRARAQTDGGGDNWRLRNQAANYLLRGKDWNGALAQARLAWQPDAFPPVAMPLIIAQLQTGDLAGAERTMRELTLRADPTNTREQAKLEWLRQQIKAAREDLSGRQSRASQ